MTDSFLEQLKTELVEAQKRLQEVSARLQRVNAEFQSVSQEVNSYQKIVEIKMQQNASSHQTTTHQGVSPQLQSQPQRISVPVRIVVTGKPAQQPAISTASAAGLVTEEANKTEMIREVLRQHPNGLTGGELWNAVKGQIAHRQYVYSVLKRLKKKGDVTQKRKKFIFTAKPEEVAQHTVQ